MKIALLTDGIHPYVIGGMQRHSFYLAKYLAQNGVEVDLYHFNQSSYDISKLEFFSKEEKKYINSIVLQFPSLGSLPGHYIRESFEYSSRIFKIFKKKSQVDFIYAKGFSGWKLIEEKKNGFKCAPIGVNFHGYEMFQKPPSLKSKLQQYILRKPVLFNIENSDIVFSYGGKITDIIKKNKIEVEKIKEISAGIEEKWINKKVHTGGKKKFVFIGRYERRKGIYELTKVVQALIENYDFEFHFIGHMPEEKKIKSKKIIYHNSISESSKIISILTESDILVCPSYSEGMPNVILEAMACGLAIIATDVGAVSLMVSEENGFLIPDPKHEEIKNSMIKAIALKNQQLQIMKENSIKKIITNFMWEKLIQSTIQIIKSAINF